MGIPIRRTRDVTPTTQTSNVRANFTADRSQFQATQAALGLAGSVAGFVERKKSESARMQAASDKRRDDDEFAVAKISSGRSYGEFLQSQQTQDWRTDEENFAKWRETDDTARLNSFSGEQAKRDYDLFSQEMGDRRLTDIRAFSRNRQKQEVVAGMDDVLNGFAELEDIEGGINYIDTARTDGWITGAQSNAFEASFKSAFETKRKIEIGKSVNDLVLDIAVQAEAEKEGTGWAAAQKWLNDPDNVSDASKSTGLDLSEMNKVFDAAKKQATFTQAEQKQELEAQQEADTDSINKLVFDAKDYNAASRAVEASFLSEKEQTAWLSDIDRRATAAAKGVPLKNDRVEEARLYDLSLGIWKGSITKKRFDDELIKNQKKLDDSAYQRVTASASNTLKSSQAEALSRADTEARNVLVDFKSEDAFAQFIADSIAGKETDIAKAFVDDANERRQVQFDSLSRYNAEVRQWIEENPDKLGKDFYQFSESLKHEYWKRDIDDLRELSRQRGDTTRPEREGFGITDTAPVQANTQEEYDRLPSGTRYVDKDGNEGTKR